MLSHLAWASHRRLTDCRDGAGPRRPYRTPSGPWPAPTDSAALVGWSLWSTDQKASAGCRSQGASGGALWLRDDR